ncbi:MAG TPA: glycosyltransferase [Nevskiaceae bacterium]|nr:glycosyltransferase [Nevskiaceae bacterium]
MRVVNMLSTYNEKENIGPMIETLEKIGQKLPQYEFMTLVVDSHSPDGTGGIVKKMAGARKNLFLLETPRGLGVSLIKGYQYAVKELKADVVIPNDCDFQWDPQLIPTMLEKIEEGYDVVVASRRVEGGKDNFNWFRKLTHFVSNDVFNYYWAGIREVKDLAGNFKAIRVKGILDKVDLNRLDVKGFVIQSTMIYELSKVGAKFAEIPAVFGERRAGETKVGFNVQFIKDIFETVKNATRIRLERSQQFFKFAVVGFIGYIVNATTLHLFASILLWPEWLSWAVSTELSIISNFTFNNLWTFRHKQVRGREILKKFLHFNFTSGGALLIMTTAGTLGVKIFGPQYRQILLPFIIVFLVVPYNYFMYTTFIWKTKKSKLFGKLQKKV